MKKTILSLSDALIYHLKGLYDAEIKIENALGPCVNIATSPRLRDELKEYSDATEIKIEKLEDIFDELEVKPGRRDNAIINNMLEDLEGVLKSTPVGGLQDAMIISCMQALNHYKMASFGSANLISLELRLPVIVAHLEEMLQMEKTTDEVLHKLALDEIFTHADQNI